MNFLKFVLKIEIWNSNGNEKSPFHLINIRKVSQKYLRYIISRSSVILTLIEFVWSAETPIFTDFVRFQKFTFQNWLQNWPCSASNLTKFGQNLSNTLKLKVTDSQYHRITQTVTGTKMRQGGPNRPPPGTDRVKQ